MENKTCIKCNEEKELDSFPLNRVTSKGKLYVYPRTVCKTCMNKIRDDRRKRNGTNEARRINEKRRANEWRLANPEKIKKIQRNSVYKLKENQYENMLLAQNKCCKICGYEEIENAKGVIEKLHVDHNHITGVVRGLICNKCNTMLARANDNTEILQKAIEYLNESKQML